MTENDDGPFWKTRLKLTPEERMINDDEDYFPQEYQAFAVNRSPGKQSLMLEFKLRTGTSVALGYAWLQRAQFDPSKGISLQFTPGTVLILGRRLDKLFNGIVQHRARWVWEADRPTAQLVPEAEPLVSGIVLPVDALEPLDEPA